MFSSWLGLAGAQIFDFQKSSLNHKNICRNVNKRSPEHRCFCVRKHGHFSDMPEATPFHSAKAWEAVIKEKQGRIFAQSFLETNESFLFMCPVSSCCKFVWEDCLLLRISIVHTLHIRPKSQNNFKIMSSLPALIVEKLTTFLLFFWAIFDPLCSSVLCLFPTSLETFLETRH